MVAPPVAVPFDSEVGVISMSPKRLATRERGDCAGSSAYGCGVWDMEEALVVTRNGDVLMGENLEGEGRGMFSRLRLGDAVGRIEEV